MQHRADIEGLRGVSVLLVVLAHAGVPGFAGGFIGVDVFFVISGYLITGILVGELRESGSIDAWRFYSRRVRRLLPAFALMLVVTLALAAALLSPVELALHAREATWAAAWAANLFHVSADTDYFSSGRETGLFLHAWSLGVEEQFYLVWPLLLWATWRIGRGTGLLYPLLGVVLVGGFAYSVRLVAVDPLAAYFLPQVRAWQFAAGALAFTIAVSARAPRGRFAASLCALGLFAIIVSALLISRDTTYPGWAALAPTLGAAAVLLGGLNGGGTASRALAWTPLTALGRVSYSWYLWHWPALVFAAALAPADLAIRAAAVLGSLAAAWLAFATIEDPLRRRRRGAPRTVALAGVLASLLLVAGVFLVHRSLHSPIGEAAPVHPIAAEIGTRGYPADCDQWHRSATLVACPIDFGREGSKTAIVIGDSIGLQWYPALSTIFRTEGWNLVVLTKSACAMVDRPFHYERIRREYTECFEWRDAAVAYIRNTAPDLVVVGSAGSYPFDAETWRDGSADFLRRIATPGRRIAVLGPTPVLPFDAPACLMRSHDALPQTLELDECWVPLREVAFDDVEHALRTAVDGIDGAAFIDVAPIACRGGRCAAWTAGRLAFRDMQHLNTRYVEWLAPDLRTLLLPSMGVADPAAGPTDP